MSKQIKISVSEKLYKIIESKAKDMGTKTSTYCFNIVLESVRKDAEKDD